jgi:hypothetical protein
MNLDWLTFIVFLISTGLLIWLWQKAGYFPLPPMGLRILFQRFRHQTWIGSAETTEHEEIE